MTAPVVNIGALRKLTLSEVPQRASTREGPAPLGTSPHRPHDITFRPGTLDALAFAVADHLSTRAAAAVADVLAPTSRTMRAAFVADALAKAARCPLCAPELAAEGLDCG